MSTNISAENVGRVGIGRSNDDVCLCGIPMSGQLISLLVSAFTVTITFFRLFCKLIIFIINIYWNWFIESYIQYTYTHHCIFN